MSGNILVLGLGGGYTVFIVLLCLRTNIKLHVIFCIYQFFKNNDILESGVFSFESDQRRIGWSVTTEGLTLLAV